MTVLTFAPIAVLIAAPVAFAQKIHTEFDPTADFTRFKTFAIRQAQSRVKKNPLETDAVKSRIETELRSRLASKGLKENTDKPDLVVSYRLGSRGHRQAAPTGTWKGSHDVSQKVTDETLVIEIRDAWRKEQVWRAVCVDSAADADKMDARLKADIDKAMKEYPPKKKKQAAAAKAS